MPLLGTPCAQTTSSAEALRKLALIDGLYGCASLFVLGAGLTLWFGVGKASSFYSSNPLFHIKLGLFLITGLLSIYPTIFFLKHRKTAVESIAIPKAIIVIVRAEIALVLLIPLMAVCMAQGVGLSHAFY